jgi:hypothetical protein
MATMMYNPSILLVQVRLRLCLAGYLALGCCQSVAVYGLRQSAAKDGDRTSCLSLAEVSLGEYHPEGCSRMKFRAERT